MTDYPLDSIQFPCGLKLSCLSGSKVETRFLYHEIFAEEIYFRHGITVKDHDTVLDIGANIGMFSAYLLQKYPQISMFAFEPVRPTFQALRVNLESLGLFESGTIRIFSDGVSNRADRREITFYPDSPANSTLFPDEKTLEADITVDALRMRDIWKYDRLGFFGLLLFYPFRRSLVRDRIKKMYSNGITFEVQFQTVSSIIKEHQLEQIDLLKIDVEGSELLVLDGIDSHDWDKIRQMVIEISPKYISQVDELTRGFRAKGFQHIEVETMGHTEFVRDSQIACNIYARR